MYFIRKVLLSQLLFIVSGYIACGPFLSTFSENRLQLDLRPRKTSLAYSTCIRKKWTPRAAEISLLSLIWAFASPQTSYAATTISPEDAYPASTSSSRLSNPAWHKAEVNAPSDDFWYPPFLIGEWSADFKFDEAVFADESKTKMPLETLIKERKVPGVEKYSVLMIPNMGDDAKDVSLRFVQLDSHPREDHPHNIREMVKGFSGGEAVIDAAPYSFQKAPDWFHSPANHWNIKFHDKNGQAAVELLTQKRNIATFAGSVETLECIRQTLHLPSRQAPLVSDYALNWQFSVPASLRDEFITVDDLRKADEVVGRLNVFVYVQPGTDIYKKLGGQPVGVYKYIVNMQRKNTLADRGVQTTVFPFVWRDAGPIELDDYFRGRFEKSTTI